MVFYSLETISNHMDGDSSVGVPLVPSAGTLVKGSHLSRFGSSRTNVVLGLPDLG